MPWGVRLLGVVALQRDGVEVPLAGGRQRLVLAALALSPGVPVPTDRLVELVWGDVAPRSARRTIQSHIASLRSLMGGTGDVPLVADGPGYVLRVERSAVDLLAFEDRVSVVFDRADADPSTTVSQLSAVLASWDEPLAGTEVSDRMRAVLAPFEELHLQATEALLVAQIDAGDAGVAVRQLESLVRRDPTREQLWLHLARALDATGRRRDAMRAVQRAREALREQLGVEPGATLRALEQRLLDGQPSDVQAPVGVSRRGDVGEPVPVREAIPSGTVCFLFTDLGRSTRLWEEHEASMNDAVSLHDDIVRSAIDDAGGYVFTTAGDSFAAAFGSAPAAARAAIAISERLTATVWPTPEPLRTRIGLHVGEAHRRNDDYFGPTVNRAARIMAAAHPGQILASGAFVALLGPAAEVLDLGEHRLKDLTAAEHLWQLDSGVFPPPLTLGTARHNLPAARTELLGRDEILVQLVEDVRRTRLLSLAGPGGVGKTRLALALGAEVLADQEGGVWVVDLASVVDGARVVAAVAEATGVMAGGGEGGLGAVADVLARRGLLLILDNCEHVLDECAELVDAILEHDGRTKVVATSREPLDVPGELVRRIPPLRSAPSAGVGRGPAVELFIERALAASPATDPVEWDDPVVAELCDRLDGMPLGIELAAAQTTHLSPPEILEQLDDRFVLLAGARRGRRHGHHTLQAVMDWSWDLLTDDEARVLEDLSVLVGDWTVEPAARVAGLTVPETTAVLGRLVAKSLVVPQASGDWTTYRLLDTVRLYGLRRLVDAGREQEARERHCAAFHEPLAELPPARKFLDFGLVAVALRDWSNMMVAMDWVLARGDAERAAELLSGTYLVWLGFDGLPPEEGYRRCKLVLGSELSPTTRAFTTVIASAAAWATGRRQEAVELAEAAFTVACEVDDPGLLSAAASHAGKFLSVTDPTRSRERCELAVDAGSAAGEPGLVRLARQELCFLALASDDVDAAEEVAAQLDECTDGYDRFATLQGIISLGLMRGQPERAVEAARASLDIYGRSAQGSAFYVNFVLAYALVAAGDDAAAEEPFEIALATQRATGLDVGLPDLLLVEARRAVNRGDVETARLIAGAIRHGGVAGRSTVTRFGRRELSSLVGKLPDPASALSLRDAADRFLPA